MPLGKWMNQTYETESSQPPAATLSSALAAYFTRVRRR